MTGGPGTGKTVVALHRVRHLVDQLPPGRTRPVLLTTTAPSAQGLVEGQASTTSTRGRTTSRVTARS
ncbi:AAA family ATPase [Streptomyces aurantiacus]|uniref:AAA family ATPase n=1 Tax=Streptomyces aurantiacus TaxID=47760 RepID=UPI0033C0856C